jgi:hypothetical protein
LDDFGSKLLAMDPDHGDQGAAKITKKEQNKGRRRPGKVHKKRLHILFDSDIKAFQGWEAVVEPWALATWKNLLNGATLGRHSHLPAMEFIENIM